MYIVKLKKKIEKIVVVDAQTDEEADKKLLAGDVVKEYEKTTSSDCYNGWAYEANPGDCENVTDKIILSESDLLEVYEADTQSSVERCLFKYTESGVGIGWEEDGIVLTGCIEGADYDGPSRKLEYPFTLKNYYDTLDEIDEQSCQLWFDANFDIHFFIENPTEDLEKDIKDLLINMGSEYDYQTIHAPEEEEEEIEGWLIEKGITYFKTNEFFDPYY